jgi:DUF4097 and DUF4098 domain-containing protein YvlB
MRILSVTTILGILGLVFAASSAQAVNLTERFEKTYPLGAGGEVQLRNVNGGVKLEAWDRNEVRVQALKKVRAGSDEDARKVMGQTKVEVSKTAGGLKIATRLPKRDDGFFAWLTGNQVNVAVEYQVWVPRGTRLEVGSVNGGVQLTGTRGQAHLQTTNGAISVARVTGDLELETTNGGIDVTESAGAIRASSTNGGIDVRLTDVPDGRDLSLSTTNGGISIQLPRDVRATVDASTSNGQVSSDFEVDGGTKSRRRVTGDINGGGGTLHIRTTNGGIHIVEG